VPLLVVAPPRRNDDVVLRGDLGDDGAGSTTGVTGSLLAMHERNGLSSMRTITSMRSRCGGGGATNTSFSLEKRPPDRCGTLGDDIAVVDLLAPLGAPPKALPNRVASEGAFGSGGGGCDAAATAAAVGIAVGIGSSTLGDRSTSCSKTVFKYLPLTAGGALLVEVVDEVALLTSAATSLIRMIKFSCSLLHTNNKTSLRFNYRSWSSQ
jgi:hypothetical protein